MSEYKFLIDIKKLKKGKPVLIKLGLKKLIAYFDGKDYSVFDAHCPHARANLLNGKYFEKEHKIQCHWHKFEFDLKEGKGLNNSFELKMYSVKIENGKLFVKEPQQKNEELFFPEVRFKGDRDDK